MEIVMVDELDDVTPEEIGEELSDSPFEPRWVMYMYEHRRPDGRVSYPLCLIYYNPAGCPVDLNMCGRLAAAQCRCCCFHCDRRLRAGCTGRRRRTW